MHKYEFVFKADARTGAARPSEVVEAAGLSPLPWDGWIGLTKEDRHEMVHKTFRFDELVMIREDGRKVWPDDNSRARQGL